MAGSLERKQTSGLLIDIALYAASALISFALLNNVLKKLDPNHEGAKQARCRLGQCRASVRRPPPPAVPLTATPHPAQAQAKKKELAKRLGRPLLDTNQYEDVRCGRPPLCPALT